MAGQEQDGPRGISRRDAIILGVSAATIAGGLIAEGVFPQLRGPLLESPTPEPTSTPNLEAWNQISSSIENKYATGEDVVFDEAQLGPLTLTIDETVSQAESNGDAIQYAFNKDSQEDFGDVGLCTVRLTRDANPQHSLALRFRPFSKMADALASIAQGVIISPKNITTQPIRLLAIESHGQPVNLPDQPIILLATEITL